ncbi:hypothetical protein FRB97_008660 [Tulasnella sp. 331]|nr:hypothetical protein FRB97_008660 [Tulasnella sp. 331]
MSIESYHKVAATMSDEEKSLLFWEQPRDSPPSQPKPPRFTDLYGLRMSKAAQAASLMMCLLATSCFFLYCIPEYKLAWQVATPSYRESVCMQEEPLRPIINRQVAARLSHVYGDKDFSARAAAWLGDAIRIPTEVFDENGPVGEDPRWMMFSQFREYLQEAFPLVHKNLTLTRVNTHGLLYRWEGSDNSLMPILFMNHQDVVPVEPATFSQWKQPPFSGLLKDGWIWGRGSCDDKDGLIGNLAAVETLLEADFKPRRTVFFAFGFDEEAKGRQGAGQLASYLKQNGPKEFAFIIDEGGAYGEAGGQMFAMVAVAEKGSLDVEIKVTAPGGHSSVPPKHTTIGLLSQLIDHLESNPHPARLTRSSSIFDLFQCFAAHAPDLPESFRQIILQASKSDKALKMLEKIVLSDETEKGRQIRAILSTTQAVDIVAGGIKINALPEEAYALVNHRISTDSSVGALKAAITSLFTSFTADRKLSLNAFGKDADRSPDSIFSPIANVTISEAYESALEPAPVTPTNTEAWRLLSGTIRSVYHDSTTGEKGVVVVTPMTLGGNTDTRFYWDLSPNIFRYTHIGIHQENGFHTVNEAVNLDGFVDLIKFYATLILNADEATNI